MRAFLVGLLAASATLGQARAQGSASAPDEDEAVQDLIRLLNTPILSASKISLPSLEAPSVVEVVNRDQIEQYGWISLNDVLYKQPGFGPAQDFDRRTVSSRGFWESWLSNHLLHLVDGIPMNEPAYSSALTSEVTPLFMVKDVEILRGPGSALYGSSATNGVITVKTLSAEDLKRGGLVRARWGEHGTRLYEWVGGFQTDWIFSAVGGYAAFSTDGHEVTSADGSGRGVEADGSGTLQSFRTNDHRSNRYAWLKLEGQGALQGLVLQYHDQSWRFQTGYGWAFWIPDQREHLAEERRAVSVSFKRGEPDRLAQEYAVRWQAHDFSWNMRFYPNRAFDGFYPGGAWEYVDSSVQDFFARAQVGRGLPRGSSLLLGLEVDRVFYTGDDAHHANFDPDTGAPNPDGRFEGLGPWMETVRDHPMWNLAPFAQFSTGDLLGRRLRVTAGARFDHNQVTIDPGVSRLYLGSGRFGEETSFSQFSPRLALVFLPRPDVSVRLMAGKAFRPASFAELGGAHTFSIGADPVKLRPETVRTVEAAVDWKINEALHWRTTVFQTRYADFIASSSENLNFAFNVFTLKNRGLETQLLFGRRRLSGFVNYSHARRVDESINDPLVGLSRDRLTWEPSHMANVGMTWARGGLSASLSAHYEGPVRRRRTEVGVQALIYGAARTMELDRYRPRELEAWVTVDGRVAFRFGPARRWGVFAGVTNLTDTAKNVLVKIGPFPFDYRQEGRRLYAGLSLQY